MRGAFRTRPEWVAALVFVVVGEDRFQVADVVVVVVVEKVAGDSNALIELTL